MQKNWGQYIKSMGKAVEKDILPDIKLKKKRKERAKELSPRNQPERELRNKVIEYLKNEGCVVKRIENSISGKHIGNSIPDLWVFYEPRKWGGWIELKANSKVLRDDGQRKFRDCCIITNVNHIVATSIADLEVIFR